VSEGRERLLYLLRHAKSSWDDSSLDDHDRPLAPRGRRAVGKIAAHAKERRVRPDLVLCSSALRARQTLEGITPSLGKGVDVRVEEELYGASADDLLARLRAVPDDVRSVMFIGHNPTLQELALLLARATPLRVELEAKFPTGALATLSITRASWRTVRRGSAQLVDFATPKRL